MTRAVSSVIAAIACLAVVGSAGTAAAIESSFVKVGPWSVWTNYEGDAFVNCAAILNNGRSELRVTNDGRSWQLGMPYYGPKGRVEVYYGFGVAGEVANLTHKGDNWAMMPIGEDQIAALKSAPSFDASLKGVDETWSLKGAAAAIDKTRACARDRGVKPAAAAPAPAPAAQPSGKNCPAPGSVRSTAGTRPVEVMFVNLAKGPLDLYWLGPDGLWQKSKRVAPNANVVQKTVGGLPWLAVDGRGACHGGVMIGDPSKRTEGDNMFQIWDD